MKSNWKVWRTKRKNSGLFSDIFPFCMKPLSYSNCGTQNGFKYQYVWWNQFSEFRFFFQKWYKWVLKLFGIFLLSAKVCHELLWELSRFPKPKFECLSQMKNDNRSSITRLTFFYSLRPSSHEQFRHTILR